MCWTAAQRTMISLAGRSSVLPIGAAARPARDPNGSLACRTFAFTFSPVPSMLVQWRHRDRRRPSRRRCVWAQVVRTAPVAAMEAAAAMRRSCSIDERRQRGRYIDGAEGSEAQRSSATELLTERVGNAAALRLLLMVLGALVARRALEGGVEAVAAIVDVLDRELSGQAQPLQEGARDCSWGLIGARRIALEPACRRPANCRPRKGLVAAAGTRPPSDRSPSLSRADGRRYQAAPRSDPQSRVVSVRHRCRRCLTPTPVRA